MRYWLAMRGPDVRPATLLRWERAAGKGRFLYAAGRGDVLAAVGEAEVFVADGDERFAELAAAGRNAARQLVALEPDADGPEPRLVGGFSFADGWTAGEGSPWRGFEAGRMVLPAVTLIQSGEDRWLIGVGPDGLGAAASREYLRQLLGQCGEVLLRLDRDAPGVVPEPIEPPTGDPDAYEEGVQSAIDAIEIGTLTKVAVAREETWTTDVAPDAVDLLASLDARFPDCFRFCVEPADGATFLGASPERLMSVRAGEVRADALAGTRRRGADEAADAALGEDLLTDDKERREHVAVVDYLRDALTPVSTTLDVAETELLRLPNVQHLHTPLRGQLVNGEGALDLIGLVHPTPAVGGLPREAALTWLEDHEPLERGWYAGGVGVVRLDGDGEFCVAIRSALLDGATTHLFAGAGIVAGSRPAQERTEVDHKLEGLREVLHAGS
ncbi:MAG: isochorismate synthase [Proteobacteria bacterium]|nr:isochorismate synthase [Pseudomonadota bacterium]